MNWNHRIRNGVTVIRFPIFEKENIVHGCSTRLGGVSTGYYGSMNLGFKTGDDRENVMENHRRFAKAVGFDEKKLVLSDQIHKTVVRTVSAADAGKGIVAVSDIKGVDGLVTNDKDVVLMTFFADCVPLFFYDRVKQAVGVAHSGWRGTVQRMGRETVETMQREFGSSPEDILVAVGPSICRNCYEVSSDVADAFYHEFAKEWWDEILVEKDVDASGEKKYQLDLWKANEIVLKEAGIPDENIQVSGLCTCCQNDVFFSHRATNGKRGSLAGVITLGEEIIG